VKGAAFFQRRGRKGGNAAATTDRALRLNRAATLRAEAAERRTDSRAWVVQRRERTRHLIELGGLVQKAGLVELTDDDRATLYGALLDLAAARAAMMPATCWRCGSGAANGRSTRKRKRRRRAMADFDIEAIRAEVRAMDFTRGTPAEVAMWREDMRTRAPTS
jgi:hypothetical protein